jgi:hypothetical protein
MKKSVESMARIILQVKLMRIIIQNAGTSSVRSSNLILRMGESMSIPTMMRAGP